jgi:hypothetical protein
MNTEGPVSEESDGNEEFGGKLEEKGSLLYCGRELS